MQPFIKQIFRVIVQIIESIVYTNVFISIAAVCSHYVFASLQDQQITWLTATIIFIGTFLSYNLCIFTLKNPQSPKFLLLWTHRRLLKCLWWAGLVILTVLLYHFVHSTQQIFVLLHLALISFFYTIPPFKRSFRQIPYLKIFLVTYVWATMAVYFSKVSFAYTTLGLFIGQLCFVVAITLPFDLRDIDQDQQQGLPTIAQRLGTHLTVYLALLFLLLATWCFWVVAQYSLAIHNFWAMLVLVFAHPKRPELYFTGLVDSLLISQSIALFSFT
jgi:hypothetical protein